MRPTDLKPASELAKDKPHGVRIKYMGGCRCLFCRAANSRYETYRLAERKAGRTNGIIPAICARERLQKLAKDGIGTKSVSFVSDVSRTILMEIKSGKRRRIREETERRILAVDQAALGGASLVSAAESWRLIKQLLEEGFTKTQPPTSGLTHR